MWDRYYIKALKWFIVWYALCIELWHYTIKFIPKHSPLTTPSHIIMHINTYIQGTRSFSNFKTSLTTWITVIGVDSVIIILLPLCALPLPEFFFSYSFPYYKIDTIHYSTILELSVVGWRLLVAFSVKNRWKCNETAEYDSEKELFLIFHK